MVREFFKEAVMKCAICKNGVTENGFTTVTLDRSNTILVFKKVPAQICNNCGEEYISAETNKILLRRAREELDKGVTLELLSFAA